MSGTPIPLIEGRHVFGRSPGVYANARPDYPEGLYDLLATRCGLRSPISAFEIGPGTGLVTKRLLRLGVTALRAVEPDPNLAAFLRQTLPAAALTIDQCPFEDALLPMESFDVGVAANSFHWMEQSAALAKVFRALRPGGWWAMWWMIFGSGGEWDAFHAATDHLFVQIARFPGTGKHGIPFGLDRTPRINDLLAAGFQTPRATLWRWRAVYETERLVELYSTFSPIQALPLERRLKFLGELGSIAERQFGGRVERPFMTVLYTAQRSRQD